MKITLSVKILFFTVPPLLVLAAATLWTVNRTISPEVHRNVEDDLKRASALFENMLAKRSEHLAVASMVIAQDPRFFSALTLPGSSVEAEFRETVAGVARAFNSITHTDLFEVFDARGQLIASVGTETSNGSTRVPFIEAALYGRQRLGLLAGPDRHFQIAATPILAGGRVVGALLLGDRIGRELAQELKQMTRSEVTFLAGGRITVSTLEQTRDRGAVLEAFGGSRSAAVPEGSVLELQGEEHVYVTLFGRLPDSTPAIPQSYTLQRAIDAETAFLRQMQARLIGLGAVAAVTALLAGFLISVRITSPVRRLVRAAEEMEHGNFDYPIDVQGQDEIGYLASRFREMRQRQRTYVASLQEVARLKSEFISVASHELRTPVSVIRGYNELLSQELMGPLSPVQRQALEAIGESVSTLNRIAEDATRVAQIEGDRLALRLSEHRVGALLERAAEKARADAKGRAVEVVVQPSLDEQTVCLDGARIAEAVTNLVTNGIRFTPDGGRVEVRHEIQGGMVTIEVEDTGIGILEERLRNLFDRPMMARDARHHHSSKTLEFNSSGLGLGLSIARGIFEMHGGTIQARSEKGRGTVFTARIPIEEAVARKAA